MHGVKRVALPFAIAGVAVALYVVFGAAAPRRARATARSESEIAAWEERYAAARGCLVGRAPASSMPSEALAVREMNGELRELRACIPLVGHLTRAAAGDDSELDDAWAAVDRAASRVATAFARYVATTAALDRDDPLPAALDALDAARRALHDAADLPLPDEIATALPLARVVPLPDDIDTLELAGVASARGLVAFGKSTAGDVQIVFAPGAAPRIARVAPGGMRAVPDDGWGAIGMADGALLVGAMDATGAIATPQTLALVPAGAKRTTIVTHGASPAITVAAVVGTLERGAIVYGSATEVAIARVDHGVATAEPARAIDRAIAAVDLDGRGALAWSQHGRTVARLLADGAWPIDLPPVHVGALCLTNEFAFVDGVAFGAGAPYRGEPLSGYELVGCTADAAILRAADAGAFAICTSTCRRGIALAGAPARAAITAVDGKLVALAAHARVLGVWREGAPPAFYALPERAWPVLAHEWPAAALGDGKVIDIIARSDNRFAIIRIPAR
jgi:hypothetical protein